METLYDIYRDTTIKKAETLRSNPHAVQRDAEDESVWWVKGSGGSKYRVQVIRPAEGDDSTIELNADLEASGARYGDFIDGRRVIPGPDSLPFVSCSCPNGVNRGGRPQCYHTAAVLLIIQDGTQENHPVMENTDPIDESFVGDFSREALKAQGLSDDEIEFLQS